MPKTCEWCKKRPIAYRIKLFHAKKSMDVCSPCKFELQTIYIVDKIRKLKTPNEKRED